MKSIFIFFLLAFSNSAVFAQVLAKTQYYQCETGGCEGKLGFLNGDFCIVRGDLSIQVDSRTACEITAVTGCPSANSRSYLYTCGFRSCTSGHGEAVKLIGDIRYVGGNPIYYKGVCEFYHEIKQAPDQREFDLRASGPFNCPPGKYVNPYKNGVGGCQSNNCPAGETWLPPDGVCGRPGKNPPDPNIGCTDKPGQSQIGNPCDPATGNKYQPETDYTSNNGLSITRAYNFRNNRDFGFGTGWSSNLLVGLSVNDNELYIWQKSGRGEIFTGGSGNWTGNADTDLSISETSGLALTDQNNTVETYDANGKVLTNTQASGLTTNFTYNSSGNLTTVTNHYGHAFSLTWAGNHIDTITTPYGGIYDYDYDIYDRLIQVTYPDNSTRQYHYEDSNFYHALTGITDENGDRYATFAYDSGGRAISTEHADIGGGAQEKFEIDYTQ